MDTFEVPHQQKAALLAEFQRVESLVKSATSSEELTTEAERSLTGLLAAQLSEPDARIQALLVQYTCSTLLNSPLTPDSLATVFNPLSVHDEMPFLREALVDVMEVAEEADSDARDEAEALKKSKVEALGAEGAEVAAKLESDFQTLSIQLKDRSDKRLGLARILLQKGLLTSDLTAYLLDPNHLPSLNVLVPAQLAKFQINERRRRTTHFYKQNKFNLLRECSEGWSKLIVLLGDDSYLCDGGDLEDAADRQRRAQAMWKRILAIIGFFDLSPPRVLDVILDAFSFRIATHWRFYVDLLSSTPWSRQDSGNVGGKGKQREVSDDMEVEEGFGGAETMAFRNEVLEEAGNLTLAQVLGFKFAHYQVMDGDLKGLHREVEGTPRDLLLMTAILMKQGMVRTLDIVPHLSPDDKGMNSLGAKYASKVRDQIQNLSGNALMNSGPLSDDTDPAPGAASGSKTDQDTEGPAQTVQKDIVEQKVLLCEALLAIGHLPPAFFLLSRWPVMAQAHPPIADLLLRIVRYMLEPVFASISTRRRAPEDSAPYRLHYSFTYSPAIVATTMVPPPTDTEKRKFLFFYPDWAERLSQCHAVDEVAVKVWPFVKLLGAQGARDVNVLVQLCRIGAQRIAAQLSPETETDWLNIIRVCLLPSMPLLPAGYSYNNELWPLLRPFKYTFRYSLYGEWHTAMTDRMEKKLFNPTMALAAARTMNDTKQVLKRMTSGLERAHARAIGKGSYSAPTALWSVILPQISSYQNMIPTVVESARYLSELGWDVTIYMLLDALSDVTKDRVKEDGLSASAWLQGVASFIGTLAKRYTAMDLEPVLQQVANQLKARSLADLITLKELIIKMANIVPLQNISPTQVEQFSGGKLLYEEGVQVTRPDNEEPPRSEAEKDAARRANKRPNKKASPDKSARRLVASLLRTKLALPILIGIAQARRVCVFIASERQSHTKQISLALDETQGILLQYLQLLSTGMAAEEYAQLIPSLRQLEQDYQLDLAVARQILRPKLLWQIQNREENLRLKLKKYRKELPADELSLATWDDNDWQPAILPTMVDSAVMAKAKGVEFIAEPFLATFWQLSLPELELPEESYRSTIQRFNNLAQTLNNWRADALDGAWADAYRANRADLLAKAEAMEREMENQRQIVEASLARLQMEATKWFKEALPEDADRVSTQKELKRLSVRLHQKCFFPRSVFSMTDATFVAKLALLMHSMGTVNFSLVIFFGEVFSEGLGPSIFSCTEDEANNLSRCLYLFIETLERWRVTEEIYNKEGLGQEEPGVNKLNGLRISATEWLKWGQFKALCKRWHKRVVKAMVSCLQSSDYLHVKNCIILGRGLMPLFPKMRSSQLDLLEACKTFSAGEAARADARDDLVILVKGYEDALAYAGRPNSTSIIKLVDDEAFCPTLKPKVALPTPAEGQPAATSGSTAPTVPPPATKVEAVAEAMDVDPPQVAPEKDAQAPPARALLTATPAGPGPSGGSAPQTPVAPQQVDVLREKLLQSRATKGIATPPNEPVSSSADTPASPTPHPPSGPRADVGRQPPSGPSSDRSQPGRGTPTEPRRSSEAHVLDSRTGRPVPSTLRTGEATPPSGPRSAALSAKSQDSFALAGNPMDNGWGPASGRKEAGAGQVAEPMDAKPSAERLKAAAGRPRSRSPPHSRKPSPDRTAKVRSGSVESKVSRTSERTREPRDNRTREKDRNGREDRAKDRRSDRESSSRPSEGGDREGDRTRDRGDKSRTVRDREAVKDDKRDRDRQRDRDRDERRSRHDDREVDDRSKRSDRDRDGRNRDLRSDRERRDDRDDRERGGRGSRAGDRERDRDRDSDRSRNPHIKPRDDRDRDNRRDQGAEEPPSRDVAPAAAPSGEKDSVVALAHAGRSSDHHLDQLANRFEAKRGPSRQTGPEPQRVSKYKTREEVDKDRLERERTSASNAAGSSRDGSSTAGGREPVDDRRHGQSDRRGPPRPKDDADNAPRELLSEASNGGGGGALRATTMVADMGPPNLPRRPSSGGSAGPAPRPSIGGRLESDREPIRRDAGIQPRSPPPHGRGPRSPIREGSGARSGGGNLLSRMSGPPEPSKPAATSASSGVTAPQAPSPGPAGPTSSGTSSSHGHPAHPSLPTKPGSSGSGDRAAPRGSSAGAAAGRASPSRSTVSGLAAALNDESTPRSRTPTAGGGSASPAGPLASRITSGDEMGSGRRDRKRPSDDVSSSDRDTPSKRGKIDRAGARNRAERGSSAFSRLSGGLGK